MCRIDDVTPDCLRTLYGTIDYHPQVPERNQLGLLSFDCEVNRRSDTKAYLEKYRPEAVSAADDLQVVSINGCPGDKSFLNPGDDNSEAALDVETLIGVGWPIPLVVWSAGITPHWSPYWEDEPFILWLDYLLQQASIPQVVSISYGGHEFMISRELSKTICSKFAQLAARGTSVFASSGDDGVTGDLGFNSCEAGNNHHWFVPTFPSTCPYVTSVGGTDGFDHERAVYYASNAYTSGGGFSDFFSRPWFQQEAVASYLDTYGNVSAQHYDSAGRGFPDIAAHAIGFSIAFNGTFELMNGTSASAPTVAAVFSLLKDAQIAAGQSPPGWLNPWLYGRGRAAFSDVTSGFNHGCNGPAFYAVKG